MTHISKLNFTITVPPDFQFNPSVPVSNAPITEQVLNPVSSTISQLSSNVYATKNGLVEGDWKNFLMRCFIPYYSSAQDRKVTEFFIKYFKEINYKDAAPTDAAESAKLKGMFSFAEQHIARGKGWFSNPNFAINSRLEHYLLAVRNRFNQFDAEHDKASLTEKCRSHNKSLLSRWNKLGFAEEAFWDSPDLVDFVFKAHLHRHITHPYYKHTISMSPHLTRLAGQITAVKEAHLMMDGRMTPWSAIRQRIKLDQDERLYSMENGQKKYWMYLDEGLTQWDKHNFDRPRRIRKLDSAPARSRIEVVTTHAHKEDWHLGDRLLKGSRHSFFRIVPGEGFSVRQPQAGLASGDVYSFGWGARWRDFSLLGPLSTMQGRWFCPDNFEFLKENLCITPIEVTDEQVLALLDVVKKRSKEERPFHVVTANCCGTTADVLNEAGILNLCTKNHMAYMWYKFLLPKKVRYPITAVARFVRSFTPDFIAKQTASVGAFLYSVVFAPIFSILGAWRTNITYENEDGDMDQQEVIRAKASNRIKALFSNVFDMFKPSKMEFDLTKNIYKWQKKQPGTTREIHD